MDDFMILDCDATGVIVKLFIHQGAICTDFAEIIDAALPNQDYFTHIRAEFAGHPVEMLHKNEWVAGHLDVEPEVLFESITMNNLSIYPMRSK